MGYLLLGSTLLKRSPHIFIVAAEKSGDELGAALALALRKQTSGGVKLSGIGGQAMARAGLVSAVDTSQLSILGFVEGLKVYPTIMQRVQEAASAIIDSGADMAVLIDSWGFMMRVAKALRKRGYVGTLVKYVAPQVWAMREGRSRILANGFDHLLAIHSFDAPYFERHGLRTTYVGNPVFDIDYKAGDSAQLRGQYEIGSNDIVIGILFGSRLSEIQRLAEPFADAVERIKSAYPDVIFMSPVSGSIAEDVYAAVSDYSALQDIILVSEDSKLDCFDAFDCALACSGTVTTQLASAGVPTVVAYKLNGLTYAVAKHLFKPDYVSIVNIAADEPLMPEFIQNDCTGENLAVALKSYIGSQSRRDKTSRALIKATDVMRAGESGAQKSRSSSERAALAILELLN